MAIKVTLRQKPISGNRLSLYLDFYPAIIHSETNKPTRREFLGYYLHKTPKSPIEKLHNRENLDIANQIRQKRENELNKPEVYTQFELDRLKQKESNGQNFVAYFKTLAEKRSSSNYDNWMSAYQYLYEFTDGHLKFGELNEKKCEEFREYLLTSKSRKSIKRKLSQNSAVSYFNKFKAAMKQAFKDGILAQDLNSKVPQIKALDTQRNFLTLEELNQLAKTECKNPLMKRAALFSALTGLRFSDIQKMIWSELEYIEGNGHFIRFKQKKTKGFETHPISEQAFSLCGERGKPNDNVFEGLKYSAYHNKHIFQWIGAANITKDITFHCFRHTYATLQLSSGADLFTVSKMLGHKDLKTTQIYAKVIDQTKRKAANSIQINLD